MCRSRVDVDMWPACPSRAAVQIADRGVLPCLQDDFFDCLSNEAAEPQVPKLSREEFRATMDEKRKLDVETFGDMAASYRPSFLRNRGRGRGRGGPRGRGRYMGGGRAGGGF